MNPPRITDTPIVLWAIVDPEGTVHPSGPVTSTRREARREVP